MSSPVPQTLEIADSADVAHARQVAREAARSIGFDNQAMEEIALAVSEIATNLVKHATRGTLLFHQCLDGDRIGLEIESIDNGPGIADVEQALTDGYSSTGSLGCGLGAVHRLMDRLEISQRPCGGTRLVCRRRVRSRQESTRLCPLDIGAATRAVAPFAGNGDAFVVKLWDESALVAVIDGLGHGKPAEKAASAARQFVERHYDQPMAELYQGVSRACQATRGVVMATARFDWGLGKLIVASVGNVEVRVLGAAEPMNFFVRRGVLGSSAPSPIVTEHRWQPQYVMILHTDGVTSHWRWSDYPNLAAASSTLIAHTLLRALARGEDDATVVVVRETAP